MPFHRHQQDETLGEYKALPLALLGMLIKDGKEYHIPLLEPVQQSLVNLTTSLEWDTDDEVMEAIHNVLLGIWTTVWMPSKTNTLPCPTERCLALRSLHQDGSLGPPNRVTPEISRFEHTMRLTYLYEMHRMAAKGKTMDEARQVMERWFVEKVYSPFNTLRSLKHRASAIVFATPAMPRSIWTDRVNWKSMLYLGHPVTLDGIREVFVELDKQTFHQWEDKVLCGLKIRVDYKNIAEDLTNTDVGYSFLSDPRNKEFHDRDRLARGILADPKLRCHFTIPTTDGSGVCWSKPALHEWLTEYGRLSGLEATRAEMLGGAPGRSSELHAMCYRNTKTRTTRNLIIWAEYVTLMRMYTKTGAFTNRDKLIPHAMDAFTGDLLIQDLAIARPFAELAVQVCFPNQKDIRDLYKYRLFVNHTRGFDSNDLSRTMERLTVPVFGFGIKINAWRHIHVNFCRKLCNRAQELLADNESDTPHILQYGHGHSIHHNIYGLSQDSLMGPSEDVLPFFLEASTGWQVIGQVVPGKLI